MNYAEKLALKRPLYIFKIVEQSMPVSFDIIDKNHQGCAERLTITWTVVQLF